MEWDGAGFRRVALVPQVEGGMGWETKPNAQHT